jgi:hypothetical protein
MKEARIRVLTNEPDYSDYQDPEYDWSSSVYGDVKEIIPTDILDYLTKKDGNDSRELRNAKRRCFVWSTSLVSR